MPETTVNPPVSSEPLEATTLTFLDFLILLGRNKTSIFGFPLIVGVAALAISFLLPKWYTATARVLPPQQSQSNAVAILGQLGVLAGGANQALGIKNPSDIYVAMLRSNAIADRLIEQHKLGDVYAETFPSKIRKRLANETAISAGREGLIVIEVEDKDPRRAAALANGYVDELRGLTIRLAVTEAAQRRLFFESQVTKVRDDLGHAEVALKQFAVQSGLINPEGQVGISVAAAATLRAQITAKEVQLAAMRTFATSNHPDVYRAQQEMNGLRTELARLEKNASVGKGDIAVSTGAAPQVSLDYLRKYRDVKYFEALFEALSKQLEIARIDEAKDATLIQVLDAAALPDQPSSPNRPLIVAVAVVASAILVILVALLREFVRRAYDSPVFRSQMREVRQAFVRAKQ